MPSDKYDRKRKKDLDFDTTQESRKKREDDDEFGDGGHLGQTHRRHRSRSPKKSTRHKKHREQSPRDDSEEGGGGEAGVESLSIEETNKLRAKLGLAPLELDDKSNTEPVEKEDGSGEKVFTEHGIEIVHKAAKNWAEERRGKDVKEKLDTRKKQREVYSKVLKAKKTLGDESDEETGADMAKWVERSRKMEEEMRKAEQKSKLLDEMDEAFGIGGLIQAEQQKHRQQTSRRRTTTEAALTGGLIVGHSVKEFGEGRETVLILQDKDILEDGGDEVLINPNMLENERHKLNVERRKKKDNYKPYEEEVDEFGEVKKQQILSKYDEGMDGAEKERETFRLDESGQYDLDKEVTELETRRRLMMLNKKFESLESTKYTLAREFHTEEEMIAFRRPKKKGGKSTRKRKALKADDLETESMEETEEEKRIRERKLAARRAEQSGGAVGAEFRETLKEYGDNFAVVKVEPSAADATAGEREDGELVDEERARRKEGRKRRHRGEEGEESADAGGMAEGVPPLTESREKWKNARVSVNMDLLKALADKLKSAGEQDEEEEEEEFPHITNRETTQLATIIEDEAEDELNAMLAKARRLKQTKQQFENSGVVQPVKSEQYNGGGASSDEEETAAPPGEESTTVVFDSTSEKYKSIGGSFGLFATSKHEVKMETAIGFDEDEPAVTKRGGTEQRKKAKELRKTATASTASAAGSDNEMEIGGDFDTFGRMARNGRSTVSGSEDEEEEDDEESTSTATYTNILGEEKDVTKGVGAMLKLAGQKGYLETGERKKDESKLKHLESKRFSKVEQGRYDIEDKTMRKLERMGTTGTGPTRPFPEKAEYAPKIEINYADQKGRILDPKEAFRVLSWKFHGKGPGKKQAEKHAAKVVKREKLKKMNSMDTPLGTLNKQLKKQEQLQAPYLVLSGRGDGSQPLQKE